MQSEQFISVIRENQSIIYKICNCYCADPDERKDLQQEILIQLWNSFGRFDGRIKISTWIYRVALNTAISYYRKNKKHRSNRLAINESIISLPESESFDEDTVKTLYRFIDRLNEFDKALMLLYLDGNKYADIADILGISETNVATKISRIKGTLKNNFKTLND